MELQKFVAELKNETHQLYGVRFDLEEVLIGVRGISISDGTVSSNDDAFDRFNDILFNIYEDSFGYRIVTMDPGKVSPETLQKYGVIGGEARTEPQLTRVRSGDHRGKPAIIQASQVLVRRDGNGDLIWDEKDKTYKGWFGVDIHAQGMEKDYVGVSSLACTVTKATWKDREWLDFYKAFLMAEAAAKAKNPKFQGIPYAIHNQDLALKILGEVK
ncbi:hypothetical protein EHO57_13990 [Leptospira langatensis]|uniref:Uncharacterized protein n=1 Tax=Leptospira langatensis TaxID=2484983 RepID=A0A5R2AT09_9LEPT|nr:hypothetical protein [Leptospira langatensis]TGJ99866.1 hypothetical protein EHO57_13990 [Leptospira langatensis]